MSFTYIEDEEVSNIGQAHFTVFGVGGGGGNAVQHMVEQNIEGVRFICANTDKQALDRMAAPNKLQIGEQCTRGLGAGGDPNVGQKAAEENREAIRQHLEGTDMVFVTAGMGGGTGTGGAPIVAEIAQEMGILTVGVVTTPFRFEGNRRKKSAEQGIQNLEKYVDSLIIIPNQRLMDVYGDIAMNDAYKKADDVLLSAVRSIFDLVVTPGKINLDFADLKTAMSTRGYAMMGSATARGEGRARQAAEAAIRSPLLDNISITDAKAILLNITGGEDLTLREVESIAEIVEQVADANEVELFYGSVYDPTLTDEVRVTVVATGLTRDSSPEAAKQLAKATTLAANKQQPITPSTTTVDPDDVPAILAGQAQHRPPIQPAVTAPKRGASIQEFLQKQQKK